MSDKNMPLRILNKMTPVERILIMLIVLASGGDNVVSVVKSFIPGINVTASESIASPAPEASMELRMIKEMDEKDDKVKVDIKTHINLVNTNIDTKFNQINLYYQSIDRRLNNLERK